MNFCQYKDIFGKPKEGVHKYRVFDIAIVDVLLTVFVAYVIKYFTKKSFLKILFILFVLGIIFHRLFCVRTTIDKLLF